ncbi:AI-2E family transporter [Dyella sp.]|jgi:predicted PurR-regulated permease PerM|uniref:AI-2E family transporter n=1 Tax=Dyella sp. TaxID=1869338 RepID=UPI002D778C49|nr:AI-2E family transporter [Dyella sp.]HET6432692.1 AI-2E family transporter [Dyella sp.]
MSGVTDNDDPRDSSGHGAPDIGAAMVGPRHAHSVLTLWSDPMGRLATRAIQALLILAVIALLVLAAVRLELLVVPVLIALIVAAAMQPLMHWFKPRMPNALAAAIALLLGGVGVGGAIAYAVVRMEAQLGNIQDATMQGLQQAGDYLRDGPLPLSDAQIAGARQSVVDFFTSREFGADAMAGVYGAAQVATCFVLGLFVLFFLLKDGPAIWTFLTRPFSPTLRDKARASGRQGMIVLGGYLRGTAIVALVDTVLIGGALWILGVPMAVPLSILVFLGAFVPIVGATVSGGVATLVALVTVDLHAALWVAGVVIAVNQLEGNLLSPLVLGKWLHLHALAIVAALTAGAILGGIVGTFLAVPLTAMGWVMLKTWREPEHAEAEQ